MKQELTLATYQFPFSADVKKNESYILNQLAQAKARGADITHFSECSLSGYAGVEFASFKERDENLLQECLKIIIRQAEKLKIRTIVGGHHFEKRNKKAIC